MKRSVLVACCVAAGVVVAVGGCGSTKAPAAAAKPKASASATATEAAATPAGYQRIGGTAQGISLAVPSSWAAVNFAQQSLQQAAKEFAIYGVSQSSLEQDMAALEKLHAVYALDFKSMSSSPNHFATNVNAYCSTSGITDTGSAALPAIRDTLPAQLQQLHAHQLSLTDLNVGGVAGVRNLYTLSTSEGTLEEGQLEVAPKPDAICFVTVTAPSGQFPTAVLSTAASTALFP